MTYFSVDVETTGLTPGIATITAVSVIEVETEEHFTSRVKDFGYYGLWEGDTQEWFQENIPESYYLLPEMDGKDLCRELVGFVDRFEKPSIFVAWPASFDYPMLQFFFKRFNADVEWPFNYRTLDVKSYMAGKLGVAIEASRDTLPDKFWIEPEDPHNPYSDALAQARSLKALLNHKGAEIGRPEESGSPGKQERPAVSGSRTKENSGDESA